MLQDLQNQVAACGPLLKIVGLDDEPPLLGELRAAGNFTASYLEEEYGVTKQHIHNLYLAAKGRYDAGEYRGAHDYLEFYEELCISMREEVPLDVCWGKMAASLMYDEELLETADEERIALHEILRRRPASAMTDLQRLQQRTWLLHWSLFVRHNSIKRRDTLIEFYMMEENLNCISLTCPWLLRYPIAAVLQQKRKHVLIKSFVRMLSPEVLAMKDPFVVFLHALLVKFDFEAAQLVIPDCCDAIATDFFLNNMISPEAFVTVARGFLFDVYCRVHQRINLRVLAKEVHMEEEEAEKWVVGLIRSATLDAKVDSEAKIVEMVIPAPSVLVIFLRALFNYPFTPLTHAYSHPRARNSHYFHRHWQIGARTEGMAARTRALVDQVVELSRV